MPEPTYRIAQRLHERRAAKGLETYGRHLDADSQGCMIVHALEEAADQVNYLIAEVQRRRKLLLDLAEWTSDLDGVEGAEYVRAEMILTYLDLGGQAALAKYDEILGGAEDATVAPDPRDEALRVATEALEYCRKEFWGMSMREATDSWLGHVAGQAEDKVKRALAAIRGAR